MQVLEQEFLEQSEIKLEGPRSERLFIASIVLPAVVLFCVAILFPVATGIFISFTNSSAREGYFGTRLMVDNYLELLLSTGLNGKRFWQYTYQTLFFSVVSLSLEFVLGLGFALILNKKFRGRGLARATLLIPWALPTVASATIFRFEIVAPQSQFGLINSILTAFNLLPIDFFGATAQLLFNLPVVYPITPYIMMIPIKTTMFTVILIDVWKTTPFLTLLILAALQIVSKDLYNAGDIAGATGWQKFRYITWPLIKPAVGIALIFRMMNALRVYDAIVVFNDSSVYSMTMQAVDFWLISNEFGLASTVSVILFGFIILFAGLILRFSGRESRESTEEIGDIVELNEKDKSISVSDENETPFEFEPISFSDINIKWIKRKRTIRKTLFYLSVIFLCLFCAVPFLWILLRSFRDPYITQNSFELIPSVFSLGAYGVVFGTSQFTGVTFARALLNGAIVSGLTVLVDLLVGSFFAYAMAKFQFKLKRMLNGFIFFANSLPPIIIIIPFFIQMLTISSILQFVQLTDNIFTLVLPYAAFNLPLTVFVLQAFFAEIPEDLWRAAKVDGATNFQIFRKVILPLTIPGIFTCAILIFISSWNELLFAQIFLTSDINHTVPRAILRFVQSPLSLQADWNINIVLMAATSIATVPLVIVVLIFQKKIISGLTQGAVKG